MPSYRTPDVYTEEISTLPPSVAEVSTAVPAFIGFTEKAEQEGKSISRTAIRISTFLEYKELFGGPAKTSFQVSVDASENVTSATPSDSNHSLYYALDFYFKNEGGPCYIISAGSYSDEYTKQAFLDCLEVLQKEDEPTLIMLGEACKLSSADYYEIAQAALAQCANLKDRFCILDVLENDSKAAGFRQNIGINNLKYAAAYTPFLQTSLNYLYSDDDVSISGLSADAGYVYDTDENGIRVSCAGSTAPKLKIYKGTSSGDIDFEIETDTITIRNAYTGKSPDEVVTAWTNFSSSKGDFSIKAIGKGDADVMPTPSGGVSLTSPDGSSSLSSVKSSKTALFGTIKNELAKQRMILPPSSAVAGIYSKTDRERGVWKAPANVSLSAVIAPTEKITSADQESLNVDSNAGKSINAIRSFFGKGTLIWGARTLAGNDNEWRYVSVRRLFNMIEESTKKASYFAVFEPNDATTWLKVKAMIDSYLYGLWQQGALAGSAAEQAYFVNVGLGKTMTQQDVLEGRMIVEIGIAAVRPAEFIILRFSHKLQEA